MTNEQYHASEGLSRSALWLYRQNQFKYWHKYLSGQATVRDKKTKAMEFGSLCHTIVLEPNDFKKLYAIQPETESLPKLPLLRDVGKAEYERKKKERALAQEQKDFIIEKFERESAGKMVIPQSDYDRAMRMRARIYEDEYCGKLLNGCLIEKSIFWTDQETGLLCKVRPDALKPGFYGVDLKTEEDASEHAFQRQAMKYGYFLQAGMIWEACKAIGAPIKQFSDLAIEKEEPHAIAIYPMDEEAIQYGIDLFHALLRKYSVSRETGRFQDYGIQLLMAPKYALQEIEYE